MWAGIVTAWMFLLRVGEWLAHDGRGYDTAKTILGVGIRGFNSDKEAVDLLSLAAEIGAAPA